IPECCPATVRARPLVKNDRSCKPILTAAGKDYSRMRLDEFRFLASDAERVQRLAPLPKMRRITRAAASGKAVSALVTDDLLARLDATVVFLHGAGLNAHTFDPTVLALGEYAVSLDLPGHGRSDWRMDARYTPSTLIDDVAHAITSLT